MYSRRIKIFVVLMLIPVLVCIGRLYNMQMMERSQYRDKIAELKQHRTRRIALRTIRGKILDRRGRVLAEDVPRFQLHISYDLTSGFDERVYEAEKIRALRSEIPETALERVEQKFEKKRAVLEKVLDKCELLGDSREEVKERFQQINDRIWNYRTFLAWFRNGPSEEILQEYDRAISIPVSLAIEDLKKQFPDDKVRLLRTLAVNDIAEIRQPQRLLELESDDAIFTAQIEFMDIDGINLLPQGYRVYNYNTVAAQRIGWVNSADIAEENKSIFGQDHLLRYLQDDITGQRPGIEHVCESILRGRRGEEIYDIDRELIGRTDTMIGRDVTVTLDIELQLMIEEILTEYYLGPESKGGLSAVVLDVATGDILALASIPTFNLNLVRQDYGRILGAVNNPLRNRAINQWYPPGSVVKPMILAAGMEEGNITSTETISCPSERAPRNWPNCWIVNRFGIGHDNQWANDARNSLKGSCNIYYARLAERIEPRQLQKWLWDFGFGRAAPLAPGEVELAGLDREFLQLGGVISSSVPRPSPRSFDLVPSLNRNEGRWFGIGQGNFMVTPLQVADSMAVFARGGVYKNPRLFLDEQEGEHVQLNMSRHTLDTILDGLYAVVNEQGGTAFNAFRGSGFESAGVKMYGKTGSTQPSNAWFAGFAKDTMGRSIAISVLVEGASSGGNDGGPLAREIIEHFIDAGYVGNVTFSGQ